MENETVTGRGFYDFLSELFSRHGAWLIAATIALVILAVAWVHYQTQPGNKVKLLGYELYEKAAKPQIGPKTFKNWWEEKQQQQ
jgi:hypothetical protein